MKFFATQERAEKKIRERGRKAGESKKIWASGTTVVPNGDGETCVPNPSRTCWAAATRPSMAHASSGPDGDWWETGLVPALALTGTAVALSSTLWDATAGRSSHLQQLMHFETGLSDAGSYTEASLAAARQIAANALIRARRAVTVVTPACLGLGCWSGAQLGRSLQSCVAAVPNDAKDSPGTATTRARNALGNIFKVRGGFSC